MVTILFGILTATNVYLGCVWSSSGWNVILKMIFIALSVWCGLELLNHLGVTSFNLD